MATASLDRTYFLPNLCSSASLMVLVITAEVLAFVLVLLKPWDEISLELFGWLSLFLQWVTLLSAAILCGIRARLMTLPDPVAALISYCIIIFNVVAMTALIDVLQMDQISLPKLVKNGLVAGLVGGLLVRYLYVRAELNRRSEAELEARIEALQSRIRPHFLFNSMNTIASLIMIDPVKAEQAVEDLSALFRATLGEHRERGLFSEEVALCKKYLSMESLRLGDRLDVAWDIERLSGDTPIPLLTLQPILENAIYHGIQPSSAKGVIRVEAYQEADQRVCIRVSNTVPVNQSVNHRGQKMALDNIRARLKAIYGESATVNGEIQNDCYVSTIIYAFQ
ncbi:sensor histidine kinase [Litoribacillus peritrichatus]|uniref:Sensor histidine kinase n=1 Tax=Litoribacillus peritrichatus TaxID=718191 RepID=A0ABP7ND09_9GAMM